MVMSTLLLFFFHIGFVIGAFLVLLIIGTLVIYLRADRSQVCMYETPDALSVDWHTSEKLAVMRRGAGGDSQDDGVKNDEESEEDGVISPFRQAVKTPRTIIISSHQV